MTPEVFDFLRELRANNNREWFQDNKKRYDALRADFISDVGQLINRIATFDPEIAGLDARSCVYRIYRDLRFSPDKTPYKTYFSAYMTGFGGRSSAYGGYYIHLEPDAPQLAGGVWCPTSPMLKQLRRDITTRSAPSPANSSRACPKASQPTRLAANYCASRVTL